jgi:hypothetical protein
VGDRINAATELLIKGYVKADGTMLLDNDVFAAPHHHREAGEAAFHAGLTGTAHDLDDRILYETDTAKVFYDRDGIGNAVLNGHPPTNAADFVTSRTSARCG